MRTENLVRKFAEDNVAHEARLVAQQVKGSYSELQNDGFVVSRTPPIEGIMRSARNGGVDSADKSTGEQWRSRLSAIFSAIMEERTSYTQIRFIGVADGGRELVRVNRIKGTIAPVAATALQRKGQEAYFQRALTLGVGETYISQVSYNREFGSIDEELIPTIRSVVPVFDDNGSLFGMIVINADYSQLLRQYFKDVSLQRQVVISNEAGDYITHFSDGSISEFQFHKSATYDAPTFLSEHRSIEEKEWSSTGATSLSYSVRLPIESDLDGSHIVITINVPHDDVYAPAHKTLVEGLALTALILVLTLTVTIYLANKMTKPLSVMTRDIEQAMKEEVNLKLPIDRKDEVGKLANAFFKLTESRKEYGARVSAVIDNVVDGIISIDDRGTVLSYNPASQTLFGYTAKEVVGRNIKMLMPPAISNAHDGYLNAFRQTGERHIIGSTRELEARRKDGSLFPMELSVSKVDLSDGSYMLTGIIRDITERRQITVMQNEFVSTVNHELRTPLTSIRASLGILQYRIAGKVDEKSQKLIDLSLRGCERLSRLVNDILDLEKIAAGKMDFHLEEFDIGILSKDIVERHQSLAEIHEVHFDLDIALDQQYFCYVDSSRYNQALVNLLSNAAKFSPSGERVKIALAPCGGGMIAISVSDNGPGIPDSFRDKIFQRFAQADSSATRAASGSGLGLNITKSIVKAFEGSIDFESKEGEGSTFTITLPVRRVSKQRGDEHCKAA